MKSALKCSDCPYSMVCLGYPVRVLGFRCPHCWRYGIRIESNTRFATPTWMSEFLCKKANINMVDTCPDCHAEGKSRKLGVINDWGYLQGEAALEMLP